MAHDPTMAEVVAIMKDTACDHARRALWYHRLEEACREFPGFSWWAAPRIRLRIWREMVRNRWYLRHTLRCLNHFDPEWARRARLRFREEFGRPVERTEDGLIVVAKGWAGMRLEKVED